MKTPFLGCAYYPEDWDESQIPYDIQKMKEAGIQCARIGEFAWHKMEPVRGQYDFGWLHHVVDSLAEAGISVVMGTPTATPPIWLMREHPDVAKLMPEGYRMNHGGRRHCCSLNPDYIQASDEIVTALAKEFGSDPNVIGWQIDNEIYAFGWGCVCPHCVDGFRRALKQKYGTVENLNRRWNLNLFSQAYDSFDEIPPAVHTWHNPHICYEWKVFHYEADMAFVHRQADILRQYTKAPIGTDMMPWNGMDYEKTTEKLDVVQFNHYNDPSNLSDTVFWFDYFRTLKEHPFWNTETAPNWNGSAATVQFLKPEGYCRINSWLPVALGGEANMYWLWRQHWAGHELIHGSCLTPEGRPTHVFGEIQQTAADFAKASDLLTGTKVVSEAAFLTTSHCMNLMEHQNLVSMDEHYKKEQICVHTALLRAGLLPDVIGQNHTLEGYKLLFTPMEMTLDGSDLADRIIRWVQEGGVWVAGPITDIRDDIGAHYTDRAMGHLEALLNVRQDYAVPSDGTIMKTAWTDGNPLIHRRWVECYTLLGEGEPLATVTAGHSALNGEVVIAKFKVGKGEVILCGTELSPEDQQKLIRIAAADAGVALAPITGDVLAIRRKGSDREGLILCEYGNKEGTAEIEGVMTDILTGMPVSGKVTLKPYDLMVLV